MLHFAYGSNMDRAVMRKHAPTAEPVGIATLAHHRFIITADGYASVEPAPAQSVYGVVWRLKPRDRVTLDRWENVASGQYVSKIRQVHWAGRRIPALLYVARARRIGRPKSGYMELVLAAARARNLPPGYIACLQRWLPPRSLGAGAHDRKEFGWR